MLSQCENLKTFHRNSKKILTESGDETVLFFFSKSKESDNKCLTEYLAPKNIKMFVNE